MNNIIPRLLCVRFTMVLFLILNAPVTLAGEAAALAVFEEMNNIDIENARLASTKGHSEEVRSLGRMIVEDHVPIQQETMRIADKLGLKPSPTANNSGYAKAMESLKSAGTGPAFDKAYMAHELPFSKDFIRKLKEEILPEVTHEELKTFLQGLISKFEEHLTHIEHIAMKLSMEGQNVGHGKIGHEIK